jgi:hypothetical protein
VLLGCAVLGKLGAPRSVVLAATGVLAVSPALLDLSTMAWTEPPFIVVTLVYLLALSRVVERRAVSLADVVSLAALCWIAFLLRYAGVVLVPAAAVVMLLAVRPWGQRLVAWVVGFGALASSVPVAWMLRNHAVDGTFLGPRRASPDSLGFVADKTVETVGGWVLPSSNAAEGLLSALGITAIVLIAAGLVWAIRADRASTGAAEWSSARGVLVASAVFVAIYVTYLTTAFLTTAFGIPGSRYLSPVYVPLVVLAAAGVAQLVRETPRLPVRLAAACLFVVFLIPQVTTSAADVRDGANDGVGFNADGWVDSDVADVAADIVRAGPAPVVYSNSPNALWAATGMQPLHFGPRDAGPRGLPLVGELEQFAEDVACARSTSYFVLYYFGEPRVLSIDEMQAAVSFETVRSAADGVVFRVTAPRPSVCPASGPPAVRTGR